MGQCSFSVFFTLSSDVKQGGNIMPIPFQVYMDGLTALLNSSNIGGQIGHILLNYLCYADDLLSDDLPSDDLPLVTKFLKLQLGFIVIN